MSEEDGAKLYDVYPHVSDSVRAHLAEFHRQHHYDLNLFMACSLL